MSAALKNEYGTITYEDDVTMAIIERLTLFA